MSRAPVVVWYSFLPMHYDRLEALRSEFGTDVVGIEVASFDNVYKGIQQKCASESSVITIFPGKAFQDVNLVLRGIRLLGYLWKYRCRPVFLAHYQNLDIFFVACMLRIFRTKVYIMQNSRFSDRQRSIFRELLKLILYFPYCGALCSGPDTESYLRFLGFRKRPIAHGYNTLSIRRIRDSAAKKDNREGYFLFVGRFVEKKNLMLLLEAYRIYCASCTGIPLSLKLLGDGPLREKAEAYTREHHLSQVEFLGYGDSQRVANELMGAKALLVPSVYEEWGFVVNEALAFDVPCIVSEAVGARRVLVKNLVNGIVLEQDNFEGWAAAMAAIANDKDLGRRLSSPMPPLKQKADSSAFATGVRLLLEKAS